MTYVCVCVCRQYNVMQFRSLFTFLHLFITISFQFVVLQPLLLQSIVRFVFPCGACDKYCAVSLTTLMRYNIGNVAFMLILNAFIAFISTHNTHDNHTYSEFIHLSGQINYALLTLIALIVSKNYTTTACHRWLLPPPSLRCTDHSANALWYI